jgi:hypothetical protein
MKNRPMTPDEARICAAERQRKSRALRTKRLGVSPDRHRNLKTLRTATQSKACQKWTIMEDVAVLNRYRSPQDLAIELGRTFFAVVHRRKALRKELAAKG